jgi:hypothetical protein
MTTYQIGIRQIDWPHIDPAAFLREWPPDSLIDADLTARIIRKDKSQLMRIAALPIAEAHGNQALYRVRDVIRYLESINVR